MRNSSQVRLLEKVFRRKLENDLENHSGAPPDQMAQYLESFSRFFHEPKFRKLARGIYELFESCGMYNQGTTTHIDGQQRPRVTPRDKNLFKIITSLEKARA